MFKKIVKFFVLAEIAAGKTTFLAGLYLKVLDLTQGPTLQSEYIVDLISELYHGWPHRTKDLHDYTLTYSTRTQKIILKTINYPNVYLRDIAEYMDKDVDKETIFDNVERLRLEVATEMLQADKLIFIIDAERYPRFEEMGIDHYLHILNGLHGQRRNVKCYIVVTKCDLFIDEYKDYENYEGFREFVMGKFSENIFIKELISSSGASFYPVFYHTRKIDNVLYPLRSQNGNIFTFGFDKILAELIK